MTASTPAGCAGVRVRRPLTAAELDFLRWRIDGSEDSRALLQSVVVAVFDALLSGLGEAYSDYGSERRLDPRQYALPQTQWTAIATAVTERARAWGHAIEVGMELVSVMPSAYEDPGTEAPDLSPGDGRPHVFRLDITREAADEITACEAHIQTWPAPTGPPRRSTGPPRTAGGVNSRRCSAPIPADAASSAVTARCRCT